MALPSFTDLGKSIKDLFSKGYHFGQLQVSTKSKTCHGVEISTNLTQTIEDKSTLADIQAKILNPTYGLTCITKWTTENIVSKEVTCQDYLARGLKLGIELRCNIDTGNKEYSLSSLYKIDNCTMDLSLGGGDENNLLVNASILAGYKSFVSGLQWGYDTVDAELKKNNIVLGYLGPRFNSYLNLENLETLSGSCYQQIYDGLEVGVQASAKGKEADGPTFVIGGRYVVDPSGVAFGGKVNNQSELGLGLEVKVMSGLVMFLSGNIDLKSFAAGGHKVGVAFEFQ